MDTVSIADGIPQNTKYVFRIFGGQFMISWSCFSEERFKRLVEQFQKDFNGVKPQFLCRAPGRVNLIGN